MVYYPPYKRWDPSIVTDYVFYALIVLYNLNSFYKLMNYQRISSWEMGIV